MCIQIVVTVKYIRYSRLAYIYFETTNINNQVTSFDILNVLHVRVKLSYC